MRKPISPDEAEKRLLVIFPRAAFDTALSSPLAALAVSVFLHVDAVTTTDEPGDSVRWIGPSAVYWASSEVLAHNSDDDRQAYFEARSSKKVAALHEKWDVPYARLYADNSRETLRDETFKMWRRFSVVRMRAGLPTSSSKPRWAMLGDFADLFDSALSDNDVVQAADAWRTKHLDPGARLKAQHAANKEARQHEVQVNLPDGTVRKLEAGDASLILRGVIEQWAPERLIDPLVLSISEPGDKVHLADAALMQSVGVTLDAANVLPDALIVDAGSHPVTFWMVEAVASDGPVTDARKEALLDWAEREGIPRGQCSFLTAFLSRGQPAARKRLRDLGEGTWAWFLDEPGHELAWYSLKA